MDMLRYCLLATGHLRAVHRCFNKPFEFMVQIIAAIYSTSLITSIFWSFIDGHYKLLALYDYTAEIMSC